MSLIVTGMITSIIWLIKSLRLVDLIINKGIGFSSFLYLSLSLIPSLVFIILPIGAVIGAIIYLNKISNDSEVIALKNGGLSSFRVIKPIILVGLLLTGINYLNSFYILPVSYREFKEQFAFVRDNYLSVMLQEGVFSSPIKGLTMFIDDKTDNGVMRGIMVHDSRQAAKTVILAKEGKFVVTDTGPRLELYNGSRQESGKNHRLTMLYFDSFSIDINQDDDLVSRQLEPEERFLPQLFHPTDVVDNEKFQKKLIAQGHNRIIWPIYSLLFPLIAACILLSGEHDRRRKPYKMQVTALVIALVIFGDISINNLITKNNSLFWLSYLYVFILFFMSWYKLYRQNELDKHI